MGGAAEGDVAGAAGGGETGRAAGEVPCNLLQSPAPPNINIDGRQLLRLSFSYSCDLTCGHRGKCNVPILRAAPQPRLLPVQVELVLRDGGLPDALGQAAGGRVPHVHVDGPGVERSP